MRPLMEFFIFLWPVRVRWPFYCLCRPFCFFERCLDSNLESWSRKQVRYRLSHPSPLLFIQYISGLACPPHLLAFHLPASVSGTPLAEFRFLIRIPGEWSGGEAGIPRKGRGKIRIAGEGWRWARIPWEGCCWQAKDRLHDMIWSLKKVKKHEYIGGGFSEIFTNNIIILFT